MQQKTLSFKVDDQFIHGARYRVVADSKNYLCARFSFSECWRGLTKTAVFTGADGAVYHVLLEEDACLVPAEVIRPARFLISVFGGDRLTTDYAVVEVEASGCAEGVTPPVPTPDIYAQLTDAVSTERQLAQAAAVTAGEKAEACGNAAVMAMDAEERAASSRNEAYFYAAEAQSAQESAQETARQTEAHAAEVAAVARSVESAVDRAGTHADTAATAAELATARAEEASGYSYACNAAATAAIDNAWQAELNAKAAQKSAEEATAVLADAVTEAELAERLNGYAPKTEWELLDDVTLTETAAVYSLDVLSRNFKELYFEGIFKAADKSKESQTFQIRADAGANVWQGTGAFGAVDSMFVYGHMFLSPGGTYVCDATVSRYGYANGGTAGRIVGRVNESAFVNRRCMNKLYLTLSGQFAAGTTFKVWGR